MAVRVQSQLMTFAEFLKVPDPPSGHYELHHGELVLMPPRKKLHATIQQTVMDLLSPLVHRKGFLTIEFPFRPTPEYEAWQADIGFVSQERWDRDDNDYFLGAPDLVIEALSDPKRKTVSVTEGDLTKHYRTSAAISLPQPLDGTIEVAAIFASIQV
jgi:Uma2 family endonuclease